MAGLPPNRPLPLRHLAPPSTLVAVVALAVAACAGASPTPVPSGGPTGSVAPSSPSIGPTVGAIDHPTGATDVVLRMEVGGGFVPIDFLATQAPSFTLYGNGVVVFQPLVQTFPEPDANGITRSVPWRTGLLDEGQVQELLGSALGPGGLGTARDSYVAEGIADAPNTIFTVHAGGVAKTVVINALSEQSQPGKDAAARAAFSRLAQRLGDFDRGGALSSDVYRPDRYRGVLNERDGVAGEKAMSWPWPAVKPTDFKSGPNDGSGGTSLPHRTLTADDVAALGLGDVPGGVQGVALAGPDGKTYGLIVRPLLPDEPE